ncbi:MAG: hypothetical protein ACRC6V_17085 [Bacteroidales bacterium]
MISLRSAFGRETTTKMYLQLMIPGYYDEDNIYRHGGYGMMIPVRGTPLPVGDTEHGTHGEALKAEQQGERTPSIMKFHSVWHFPVNALVHYNNHTYKIIRKGDYSAAGFWSCVGATDTTAVTAEPLIYPEGMSLLRGMQEIPISRIPGVCNAKR